MTADQVADLFGTMASASVVAIVAVPLLRRSLGRSRSWPPQGACGSRRARTSPPCELCWVAGLGFWTIPGMAFVAFGVVIALLLDAPEDSPESEHP